MRDVAVISFASSAVAEDWEHNETETIVPVVRDALAHSGLPKSEIGFVCSGSLDYLQGGPFAFVSGLDAVGAWPPLRESHVEMDAAWALYEAWVAIQTGEVDAALVYGFGKSSPGDLHEIMALQIDPYYVLPLWPSMVDVAALQASAYLEASGHTEKDLAEVAARAQRNGQQNPDAVRKGELSADDVLAQPVTHHPLRDADIAPITDGAAAVVIAAGDLARRVCDRPAWIRGIEHRIEAHGLGVRDLTSSESAQGAARGGRRRERQGRRRGAARPVQPRGTAARGGAGPERQDGDQSVGRPPGVESRHERGPHPDRRGRASHHERRGESRRRACRQRPLPPTEPRLRPGGGLMAVRMQRSQDGGAKEPCNGW